MSFDKLWRKGLKHGIFLVLSFGIAHVFLSYFVSLPSLWTMMRGSPAAHPVAFAWSMAMTLVLYFNFAWFREQLCLIICPHGRLQSALTDEDTMVIGYDVGRGEPRGKKRKAATEEKGDCIDCGYIGRGCMAPPSQPPAPAVPVWSSDQVWLLRWERC